MMIHCIQQYCKEFYNSVVVTTNPGVPLDSNGDRAKAAGSCARCFLVGI